MPPMLDPGLLAAVVAEPDDDELRLICADWFEERGEPYGEFIRCQIEIDRNLAIAEKWARTPSNQPGGSREDGGVAGAALATAQDLQRRERELLQSPSGTNFRPDCCYGFECRIAWRHGFVEAIRCTWQDWCDRADVLRAALPLRKVDLATPVELEIYSRTPIMAMVETLRRRLLIPQVARVPATATLGNGITSIVLDEVVVNANQEYMDGNGRLVAHLLLAKAWPGISFSLAETAAQFVA